MKGILIVGSWILLILSFMLACYSGTYGVVAFIGGCVASMTMYAEFFINKKVAK